MNRVVGIAGPTGGGKTTLVNGLVAQLQDACAIHMDDYEHMTREPTDKVMHWSADGADFDALSIPLLADHLARLKRGEPVREPARGTTIAPRKTIVFETQFGRAHRATGVHVDWLIWIDVPLEIALARKLKTMLAAALADENPAALRHRTEGLHGYLGHYLSLVRPLLLLQAERVRPGADLIIDGMLAPEAMLRAASCAGPGRTPQP